MNTKFSSIIAAIALCAFAACSDDSSSPTSPAENGNSSESDAPVSSSVDGTSSSSEAPSSDNSSSSVSSPASSSSEACTESPMTVEEMKSLLESFNFPTTTTGTETSDAKKPMYKVSHEEFSVAACDTTYPAIMLAAEWKEEASTVVGSGNFISIIGYRYIKKYGCTDIAISFICRDGMEGGTTNFYVEYLKNARKEHLSVGTYE